MKSFKFKDHEFQISLDGILFWIEKKIAIISDLHLEKGSSYASTGQLIPPYDSLETLNNLIKNLEKNGIETRPIISGNFAKQPAAIKYGLAKNQKFPNTDDVYNKSFFIGLPTKYIKDNYLDKIILAFEKSL